MAQDALERLFNSAHKEESAKYSVEEQMASVSDDDFLESMSDDSRNALLKSVSPTIQEVTLDNTSNSEASDISDVDEEVVEDDNSSTEDNTVYSTSNVDNESNEVLFNHNIEDKQGRKQRGRPKTMNENRANTTTINQSSTFDPIMNQLALNVLNDLQGKKFKLNSFDDNLMQIVFDYMRTKFV